MQLSLSPFFFLEKVMQLSRTPLFFLEKLMQLSRTPFLLDWVAQVDGVAVVVVVPCVCAWAGAAAIRPPATIIMVAALFAGLRRDIMFLRWLPVLSNTAAAQVYPAAICKIGIVTIYSGAPRPTMAAWSRRFCE